MISQELKIPKKEKMEFEPLPQKVYQVQIFDINLEKKPTYDTRNKPDAEKQYEFTFNFQFTLLNGKDKDGKDLRGRNIWQNFVPTYLYIGKNGKNVLYQILEASIGRELTQEEEATMDQNFINSVISKQLLIVVKKRTKGDKTFNVIESFIPADNELTPLTPEEKDKSMVKNKKEEKTEIIDPDTEQPIDEDEEYIKNLPF